MQKTLTRDQIDTYNRDGYLLINDAIPADLLARARHVTDRLIDDSRHISEHNDIYDLDSRHSADEPRLNRIKTPHLVDQVYADILRCDAMLDLLRPLLGPNIRLNNSKLNTKAAQGGAAVHWHQDWAFYPHTNDDLLAIGVMLSDIDEADGPLQMVPGSHTGPVIPHFENGVFCGAIDPADEHAHIDKAVSITGKAGSVSLHHVRTLHGSAPNTGKDPRLLLLYELGAADAWPINGALSGFTGLTQRELWQLLNDNMVCGEHPTQARLANVPVTMPLPPPDDASSIFQVQKSGGAKDSFTGATLR